MSPLIPVVHCARYEMKATGKAQMAGGDKVLDLYAANLQLEEQLHQVRREVEDAKSIAGKVLIRPACDGDLRNTALQCTSVLVMSRAACTAQVALPPGVMCCNRGTHLSLVTTEQHEQSILCCT